MHAIVLGVLCLAMPIFLLAYIRPNFAHLEEEEWKESLGSMYDSLDLTHEDNPK